MGLYYVLCYKAKSSKCIAEYSCMLILVSVPDLQQHKTAIFTYSDAAGYMYAKQKQPGCKKVRGQSEATMVISNQKL